MKRIEEVHFIEARSPGTHVFSAYPIPRLGTVLLATILRGQGYRTRVFIEDVAEPDWDALEKADLVGISSTTSTAPRAYALADRFRALGKTVAMGGPHPTFMPDEALMHSDFVVRGEGEETVVELLGALKNGGSLEAINGLSFNSPAGRVHNPPRELIQDLDRHPAPDFSLVHGWRKRPVIPIATSRGCPFDCKFCSVIKMFGRKYRFKPVGRVIEELRAVKDPKTFVFFVDDNFTADRGRTRELLGRMISDGVRLEWSAQVRTDAAGDPELLRLMKRSGCKTVFVGFESINPRTLKLFNKRQSTGDIVRSVKAFKSEGIAIHGMFVMGADTDDVETIRATGRFARSVGIDTVQFLMLTPLPGSDIYDELKDQGRILHFDWSKYDAHHAVYSPALMSPAALQRETFKAMAGFYSWGGILERLARLDFYYSMLRLYGKRSVSRARRDGERYLAELKEGLVLPGSLAGV